MQELGLLNVPPPVKEIPVTMAYGTSGFMGMGVGMPFMPVMRFGGRGVMTVATQGMFQTYEGLSKAVDSYNDVTKAEPLEGQRVRGVGYVRGCGVSVVSEGAGCRLCQRVRGVGCVGRWKVRGCGVSVE